KARGHARAARGALRRHLQGAGRDLSARQSARHEDRAQRRAARGSCALAAHGQSRQGGRGATAAHGDRGARQSAAARTRMSEPKRKPRARRNNESNRREELLRVSAKLFRRDAQQFLAPVAFVVATGTWLALWLAHARASRGRLSGASISMRSSCAATALPRLSMRSERAAPPCSAALSTIFMASRLS